MKALREWWINGGWARRENNFGIYDKGEIVHVVELPADHIVVSRERLREAWDKADREVWDASNDPHATPALEDIMRELFGEVDA